MMEVECELGVVCDSKDIDSIINKLRNLKEVRKARFILAKHYIE